MAVIRRHRDDLDDAERRVNEVYGAWKRGDAVAIGAQLDEMLARWRALPDGGELVVDWPRRDRRVPRPVPDRSSPR